MSVVAYDGRSLAADRIGLVGDVISPSCKLVRLSPLTVVAWCGMFVYGKCMVEWYKTGANPKKWPEFQRRDDWVAFIVAEGSEVFTYESEPMPIALTEPFWAWGSGQELALGALAMGATAKRAVEIANKYSRNCGEGVDVIKLSRRKGRGSR